LEANAREALAKMSLEATVEKVTDLDAIINMGVMMTPALAVDGVVKSAGKVLGKDEIAGILQGRK
jgi:small redox-active disulfide protein 2